MAVRELTESTRHAQFRSFITRCKGCLTTFPAAMGVLAAAGAIYGRNPFAGAAVAACAGKELRDLWIQSRSDARAECANPNRLLWKLGVEKSTVFRARSRAFTAPPIRLRPVRDATAYHWLCPPTDGVRAVVLRDGPA